MGIKSIEGLKTFCRLQTAELQVVRNDALKIPHKTARLLALQDDEELAESICDSIALKVHGIYTGIESILKNVAKEFDDYVPDGDNWHMKLLNQMSTDLGNRKRLLSPSTKDHLNELRSFRHFLRNDYGAVLTPARVIDLGKVAVDAVASFARDWDTFQRDVFEIGGIDDGVGGESLGG